jgi:hypothetical protein
MSAGYNIVSISTFTSEIGYAQEKEEPKETEKYFPERGRANGQWLASVSPEQFRKGSLVQGENPCQSAPGGFAGRMTFSARPDAVLWPKCPDRFKPPANRCCLSAKGSMLCLPPGPGEASPGRHHRRAGGLSNRSPICRAVCRSRCLPAGISPVAKRSKSCRRAGVE